jgi:hypothetical protein
MADKKSFALRMDAETMKAIEKWAADEFRSVNGQIEWMLHRALKDAGRLKESPAADDDVSDKSEKGKK